MFESRIGIVLALVAAALAISSCGSGEDSTSAAETAASGEAAASRPARISVGEPHGRVLVGEKGRTLYIFEKEPQYQPPMCYGKCAEEWPPLLTSDQPVPVPNKGLEAGLLGSVERKDGSLQVTYAGHPLYEYARDRAGDAKGFMVMEFGGRWFVITPPGVAVTAKGAEISTGVPGGRPVLVSEEGETLYSFEKDPKGGQPTCYGSCAKAWPPLLTPGPPTPYEGRTSSKLLGTVKRRDGGLQVTYGGHPLYLYSGGEFADTKGFLRKEFGGTWYLVTPSGNELTRRADLP